MNLRELQEKFDTQDKCLDFIEKMRWPEGVRCVTCGCDKISRVTSSSKKQTVRKLYECLEPTCKQQFTATSGTVMHDTHLPLSTWLCAIALITQAKKGMSARQLQRHLGIGGYKTAWHLCHRIREAMKNNGTPLAGVLELDETYVGGKLIGQGVYKARHNKTAVIGLIERGGELRLQSTGQPFVKGKAMRQFVNENISPTAALVCTDESSLYPNTLQALGDRHQTVMHKNREYVRGTIHTNSAENAFSLLKRSIIGNFHQVSVKHLNRYCTEAQFKFNNRRNPSIFGDTLRAVVTKPALPFAKLTA